MTQPNTDVVKKSITVARSVEGAFRVWTEQIAAWWPAGHSRSGDPKTQVLLEGYVGGRFYERTSDGVEYDWGQVVVWEPPTRLAYTWVLGSGEILPTRVDVYFYALGPQQTRVDIEHRGPELIGALWWTNQVRYATAWATVLPHYGVYCAAT